MAQVSAHIPQHSSQMIWSVRRANSNIRRRVTRTVVGNVEVEELGVTVTTVFVWSFDAVTVTVTGSGSALTVVLSWLSSKPCTMTRKETLGYHIAERLARIARRGPKKLKGSGVKLTALEVAAAVLLLDD